MDYLTILTGFAGGIGLFLYGMHIMASGLQKAAGNKLKKILGILTKNKFTGVLIGAFVTAIMQSSSSTTVMVVGFVNAGLMTLSQSVGIIMGANVGTTITSWIVSSREWATFLDPEFIAPIAVCIGAAMLLFAKGQKKKLAGEIVVGFGLLFMGISLMGSSVEPLSGSPVIKEMFEKMGRNPFLGLLVGTAVTALIQSSAASVGILQSLAISGLVTWNSAIYIIMGQNIGTCVTALLSSIGASKTAKGAAYIHLLFNVIGSVIFSIAAYIALEFVFVDVGNSIITATQISIAHTVFNIANTAILYPFSGALVRISEFMCKRGKETDEDEAQPSHLDYRILGTPAFAIENCIKEIVRLGNMSLKNLKLATEALEERKIENIEKVLKREAHIDSLQQSITQYLVKLCNMDITEEENEIITSLFHTVNDYERIGDHCENIVELAQFMDTESLTFSDAAMKEIEEISSCTIECVENSIKTLETGDPIAMNKTMMDEKEIDKLEEKLRSLHIERLSKNECDAKSSIVFLDLLTNLERASDHALNVVEGVLSRKEGVPLAELKVQLK
ncbi:MAG: Na/Pi cotransporter family protein [Firmicutes bacterium]|nr:Na/Pi cotransporter family protein [Bacillota bacterium]